MEPEVVVLQTGSAEIKLSRSVIKLSWLAKQMIELVFGKKIRHYAVVATDVDPDIQGAGHSLY